MFRSLGNRNGPATVQGADPPAKLIFISYRRTDSAYVASQLAKHLEEEFGKQVFIDHTSIPPGAEFPTYIDDAVRAAKVVLVLIGKDWQNCKDEAGRLRLADPDVIHRREIELAYRVSKEPSTQGIGSESRIVPVFLDGGDFKSGDSQLPSSLDFLRYLNGLKLRSDARDYLNDLSVLKDHVHQRGVPRRQVDEVRPVRWFWPTVCVLVGIAVTIAAVVGWRNFVQVPAVPQAPLEGSKQTRNTPAVGVPFFVHLMEDDRIRIEGATEDTIVWIAKTSDDEKIQKLAEKYEKDPKTLLILLRKSLTP